jgi:23S rRNA (guanosine2251-2'-O)-methyltransferase
LLTLAKEKNVPVQRVPPEKLTKITTKNHQGVIAYVSVVHFADIEDVLASVYESGEVPLIVVLDRITDVRNFGAIVRSAVCMGAHAVLIPAKGSAQIGSDAVKTSAGALHFLPVCRAKILHETLKTLKDAGLKIIACTEKAEKAIFQTDYTAPLALVVGSEENGIASEILKISDEKVLIPMVGRIESLNVSVAAGILLYEVERQRLTI